ncbi:MAG TPA: TRAP transporter small permease [Noviherbaspirillum sp.]|uniref:TRAP transporter small permease n=1 Tax=Noviherbaspirillum sp. TaxID=1926288 RepID=UPI002B4848C0|nr:TRAP transporter small permease [Noviherbaspirillum sp.]HJV87651.1 TRAP transporter small permease [Noviherbaspirillum sp.]
MFSRLGRWASRGLEWMIVACLSIMAILVFGNVVLRYAFNSGIAVSEELARLLFVWLIFLGAILASAQHAHIGFDSLVTKLPTAWRKALIAVTAALMLAACVMFISGGWQQMMINLDNAYPVLGISYAWLYAVAIAFGVGMIFTISANVWKAFRRSDEDLVLTKDIGTRIEDKMDDMVARRHQQHQQHPEKPE